MAIRSLSRRIAAMPTRYDYDLDHNGEWRWIALGDTGQTQAVSPVGYAHLQDCLHAVGLMQAPGEVVVAPALRAAVEASDRPGASLSRLHRLP
jgi:uncharacterized protein YegP (UPF0339 family)